MIYFRSDYSQGAHPKVLDALQKTNLEHTDGYGLDVHCENAAKIIKQLIGREDCDVHMMVGGTPCNVTLIDHMRQSWLRGPGIYIHMRPAALRRRGIG